MNDFNTLAHAMTFSARDRDRAETWEHRGLMHERLGRNPDLPPAEAATPPTPRPTPVRRALAAAAKFGRVAWSRLPHSIPQNPAMGATRLTFFGGWSRV